MECTRETEGSTVVYYQQFLVFLHNNETFQMLREKMSNTQKNFS